MEKTIGDLYEALYAQLGAMDRIVEFWIGITFAVIVATFFAGNKLTRLMYALVTTMYGIVSAYLALRYLNASGKFTELQSQLISAGEWMPTGALNISVGFLSLAMYVVGTLGTLYFLLQTYNQGKRSESGNS